MSCRKEAKRKRSYSSSTTIMFSLSSGSMAGKFFLLLDDLDADELLEALLTLRAGFLLSAAGLSGGPPLIASDLNAARVRFLPVDSVGLEDSATGLLSESVAGVCSGACGPRIVDMKSRAAMLSVVCMPPVVITKPTHAW